MTNIACGTRYLHFCDKHALLMAAVERHHHASVPPYLRSAAIPMADPLAMFEKVPASDDACVHRLQVNERDILHIVGDLPR